MAQITWTNEAERSNKGVGDKTLSHSFVTDPFISDASITGEYPWQ